ncbi:hypothetical protein BC828DRAFT_380021, partial [Blastocladiella britannica]
MVWCICSVPSKAREIPTLRWTGTNRSSYRGSSHACRATIHHTVGQSQKATEYG